MAPAEPASQPRLERMLESLSRQMRSLKTPGMAGKVLKGVKKLSEEKAATEAIHACLNVIRCLPAFRELDDMAVTDSVKQKTAESMILGLTPIQTFFGMLPSPELHNGCKDYDKLAELYRSPAEVLAARFRLEEDPFKSFDPSDSGIVEVVLESTRNSGTWNMHGVVHMDYGGIAHLEGGLARQALHHTPATANYWYKDNFYSYLSWVVQGRKTSACPFAPECTTNDGTTPPSRVENLLTLSDGGVSGSCASCGSRDAAHTCKLCSITLDDHGSEHIVSATTYCNENCRNTHFEAHRASCKEIRKLARSAALFKEAFYHYLQAPTGVIPLSAVTREQGIVTKHYDAMSSTKRSIRHLAGPQWQADAAMTGFTCNDIPFWARPMFEFFIRPCCATAEFITHSVKNAEITVADDLAVEQSHRLRYNTLGPHVIVRLTLPSGLQYAFDPTAAQFGWKEYLAPWDEYARRRIHLIDMIGMFKPPSDTKVPNEGYVKTPGFQPMFFRAKERAAAEAIKVVRARKGGLRAILKLSDGQFEEAKKDLSKTMEQSIQEVIKSSE